MAESVTDQRLLILIVRHDDALDELVTGLLDAGIHGATVIESKGLGQYLRQEMPIFAGLAALLPQTTGSRVVISLTTPVVIDRLRAYVAEMLHEDRPIAIVLPVADVFGLGQSTTSQH